LIQLPLFFAVCYHKQRFQICDLEFMCLYSQQGACEAHARLAQGSRKASAHGSPKARLGCRASQAPRRGAPARPLWGGRLAGQPAKASGWRAHSG